MNELCHRDTADSLHRCFRWLMSPVLFALLWRFKCCQLETPGNSEQWGVLPVHCTNAQFPLRAWWEERGKRAKPLWCHHLPKVHGGVLEYWKAVSDWKACIGIPKRPSYNSHLPLDTSSAEVLPESFILCFNKLIHPTHSFWATLVLGNSVTLKAEVQGQQLFISVDAPQRRWACWASHLEGKKQSPLGLTQWGEKARAHNLTRTPLCWFWLRDTTAAPPGAHGPWNSSRSHMHHGMQSSEKPCAMPTESENPSVYEGKQSPNNRPQNYYNSSYFFSRLSPQLSWWCRQTAEVHVQIAKL